MSVIRHGFACDHCGSSRGNSEWEHNFYCFSCKTSVQKQLNRLRPIKKELLLKKRSIEHPPIYERNDNDPTGVSMCEKAYITAYLRSKYNIHYTNNLQMWSERLEKYFDMGPRMILPHPGGFDAKDLTGTSRIKYVTWGSKDVLFKAAVKSKIKSVCIVEDIFSAIRVGELMPCVALLGTNLSKNKEHSLRDICKHFIIWLDADKAGRTAATKIKHRLDWGAKSTTNISTQFDPKCYTDEEIKDILGI